ncbi:MAG: bifunctional precorrin-2 dehydrogenase/sirohydrochlorin ferrochelatase [Lachnospiraceae bacterium]|nr:bifunctional precorrin-2 dehydrogenase/sirohydrochlorin ferrochelatase [Lachnospiraceae bacterium]MDY4971313.1 bifunctional precorrin-2 dehydrogenase/sirohydrochlorin ferrochelatase [Lachnospiraceae bacterium]
MMEKNRDTSGYFPMFFNIEGRKILIVGAGHIALRRVDTLLSFGAVLTVAAPVWEENIGKYEEQGRLTLLKDTYTPDLIESDYFMVIAATDNSDLNSAICREGKRRGILVNNASDKSQCDFYFPAIVRQGDVIAGVCAGGKDHRLVRRAAAGMRDWLKKFMEEDGRTI